MTKLKHINEADFIRGDDAAMHPIRILKNSSSEHSVLSPVGSVISAELASITCASRTRHWKQIARTFSFASLIHSTRRGSVATTSATDASAAGSSARHKKNRLLMRNLRTIAFAALSTSSMRSVSAATSPARANSAAW